MPSHRKIGVYMPRRQRRIENFSSEGAPVGELESQTLYTKKSTAIWLLLICATFVIAGLWMGNSRGWVGYACAAFFALGIPIALIQLIPGSSFLKLEHNGLVVRSLFRESTILWQDVHEFFVVTLEQRGFTVNKMVGFNYVSTYDRSKIMRRLARGFAKCEGSLPDTYGMGAEELASMLNSYLRRLGNR